MSGNWMWRRFLCATVVSIAACAWARPGAVAAPAAAPAPAIGGAPAPARAAASPPTASPAPAPAPPMIAFPGQYALPPPGQKLPVWPKGCQRFKDGAERLACTEFVLGDWPRLDRFAAANAALAAPRPGERRVVFMGDSITDLWSRPGHGGFFPGKPYVNRGIGGQTTGQMLVRFRADVIALGPAVVVIHAGTNDVSGNAGPTTPAAIQNNLASMADLARANGIRVVLAALLPVSDDKLQGGAPVVRTLERPPAALRALNRWLADFARKNGHVFLDYHGALVDERGLFKPALNDDGLHPNAAGYAVMAPLAEQAIAAALAVGPAGRP